MPHTLHTDNLSTGSLGNGATYTSPPRQAYMRDDPGTSIAVRGRVATAVKVTANPAQNATVFVELGDRWGDPVPTWTPLGSLALSGGGGSQSFTVKVEPCRWTRIRVVNGATVQTLALTVEYLDS